MPPRCFKGPSQLTNYQLTPPLRHLDLDLEEPVGGIGGANPRRIRQVRLAKGQLSTVQLLQ